MNRFHATASGAVPYTEQEEAARDAEEAAIAAAAPAVAADAVRLADIDAELAADAFIATAKTKTITELKAHWNGRTALEKDRLQMRLFILMVRRVL